MIALSGNEITDAVRTTGTQGDGLATPAGVGAWQAATNLLVNGGFEANTTGWTNWTTGVISRITTDHKFGAACGLVTTAGTGAGDGVYNQITASASTAYTASVWLNTGAASGVFNVAVFRQDNAVRFGLASVPAFSGWQRIVLPITTDASTTAVRVFITQATAGTATCEIDGAQVEAGAFATPYVETNGATASRSAARAQAPATGLTRVQGWVAANFLVGFATSGSGLDVGLFDWRQSGTAILQLRYDAPSGNWQVVNINTTTDVASAAASQYTTWSAGTVVASWTSTTIGVSVNGGAFVTASRAAGVQTAMGTLFDIGSLGGANQFNGNVRWFACGTGTLANTNAATLAALGTTVPTSTTLGRAAELRLVWPAVDASGKLVLLPASTVTPHSTGPAVHRATLAPRDRVVPHSSATYIRNGLHDAGTQIGWHWGTGRWGTGQWAGSGLASVGGVAGKFFRTAASHTTPHSYVPALNRPLRTPLKALFATAGGKRGLFATTSRRATAALNTVRRFAAKV